MPGELCSGETMEITLYHNPRCSKSRATLALIEKHGVQARVIEYLNEQPVSVAIRVTIRLLNRGSRRAPNMREKKRRLNMVSEFL